MIILKVIFYSIAHVMAIPSLVLNWINVRVKKKHLKYEVVKKHSRLENGKFVIIAVYAGTGTYSSLKRQIELFEKFEYNILVILNENNLSRNWAQKLINSNCSILHRKNIGADFGAYKLGAKYLHDTHRELITEIVLANDSIYYTPASTNGLKSFLATGSPLNCLFYHKQSVRHAGSMLIKFDFTSLDQNVFWQFWKKYYPYSTKLQVVRKGEHMLSKSVGHEYFKPVVNLSEVDLSYKDMNIAEIIQAQVWAKRSSTTLYEQISLAVNALDYRRILHLSISNLQISNSIGLWISRNLDLPFKLDLPQVGLSSISDLLKIAELQGCQKDEVEELQVLLNLRPNVTEGTYFTNSLKFIGLVRA
jgi:hypothetical protein